jgi:hypothetical protein
MKKLTYDVTKANYIDKCNSRGESPVDVPDSLIEAIVDSINESIEQHNRKNYICNECDGSMVLYAAPIDIYKCDSCGNIKDYKQESTILSRPTFNTHDEQ